MLDAAVTLHHSLRPTLHQQIKYVCKVPKCFLISTEGAQDLEELCKYGYDHKAKGREWDSHPTSSPNPRTNKQFND